MASMKALVTLAFTGSIGMTFVILACALPAVKVWWPMIVVLFYLLAPIPTLIARRQQERFGNAQQSCMDLAIFITMGLVVSSFALPMIMARTKEPTIELSACYLTLIGNTVIYFTYIGFFLTLFQDDYGIWNNTI